MSGKFDKYDNYICHCGNYAEASGFETCLEDGTPVEPDLGSPWDGFYSCNQCGAIFNLEQQQAKK